MAKGVHEKPTVGMQSSISADVAFAKTVGLVVQRRLLPKQIWLMRDATTQELIVEYEPRSGICYTAIDGKSHHVRKWSVRQAIQFASQHLAKPQSKDGISCPTPERVNRPTSDSDYIFMTNSKKLALFPGSAIEGSMHLRLTSHSDWRSSDFVCLR